MMEETLGSPLDCKIKPVNPKDYQTSQSQRRSNQSIPNEIKPEYSLEGLVLNLKLSYYGHLLRRTDSLEKSFMLGKVEGKRRRGGQRMRGLDGIIDSMEMSLRKVQQIV